MYVAVKRSQLDRYLNIRGVCEFCLKRVDIESVTTITTIAIIEYSKNRNFVDWLLQVIGFHVSEMREKDA